MIKQIKKICKSCNTEQFIWKNGECKLCSSKNSVKKPIKSKKKGIKKRSDSPKAVKKREDKKEYTQEQWKMFLEIWNEREHICFETGVKLYGEPLSTMFHHCLFKSQYPQFALIKENIVILDPNIHQQVHQNMEKTPKVREYTQKLREKYLE